MSRYDAALSDVVRWLEIDTRGWGMVLVASGQQVEVATALAALVAHRPHVELRGDGADALDQILAGLADDSTGAFLTLAPTLTATQAQRVLGELNSRRGWLADRGKWVMVLSQPDLVRARRHAGDVTSIFGGLNRVPFIPRPMSDDDVATARRELHEYYRGKFGHLDLRGFIRSEREDVSFAVEDIYQPLDGTSDRINSIMVEDGYDDLRRHYTIERVPLLRLVAFAAKGPLVLVGGPGSGKSFFLRRCALTGSHDDELAGQERPVPIYVPLAAMRAGFTFASIEDYVAEDLLQAGLAIAHAFAAEARAGRVLYLLDGVDEVGGGRQHLADDIRALAERNPQCRVLLTSRPNGLDGVDLPYEQVIVKGLSDEALQALLRSWCGLYEVDRVGPAGRARGEVEGEQLARDVLASAGLRELARTPLLATIIAIVHRAGVRLPDHRIELYEHIMRILVERWNQLRSMSGDASGPPIKTSDAIRLLGPVAYALVERGGDGAIDEGTLRSLIASQLARGTVRAFGDADEAMATFRDTLGLIVEQSPGIYAFLHKSLGEFLAAHEAVRTGALESVMVPKHCFEARWREVILLALAIVGTVQASDDRLAAAVTKIIERAHQAGPASRLEVPALLAGILADDPGLTPVLADSLCRELVPTWWFDSLIHALKHGRENVAVRILAGSWKSMFMARVAAAYDDGFQRPFASPQDSERHATLCYYLEDLGIPIASHICEWVLRWCFQPWRHSGVVPAIRYQPTALSVRPDGCAHFAPAYAAEGQLIAWLWSLGEFSGATFDSPRWRPEYANAQLLSRPSDTMWCSQRALESDTTLQLDFSPPTTVSERLHSIPEVLAIWRELAAIYPDGPQPPASVEEAFEIYAPKAGAPPS